MKPNRFWIEVIALGTSIASAIALLIATLGAATAGLASSPALGQTNEPTQAQPGPSAKSGHAQVFEGMVTCSRCGAKHSAKMSSNATDCARKCVHSGASFALIDGDNTYALEGDVSALKQFAGQRVRVTGVRQGNTIQVASVAGA